MLLIMIYLKTLCLPYFVLSFLSAEGPREGFDLQTVLNGRFLLSSALSGLLLPVSKSK